MELIIKKMITINFNSSNTGLSLIIWERSNKALMARIHSLIKANTLKREYPINHGVSDFLVDLDATGHWMLC
eukprot:2985574-Rhodomonas_salina.3